MPTYFFAWQGVDVTTRAIIKCKGELRNEGHRGTRAFARTKLEILTMAPDTALYLVVRDPRSQHHYLFLSTFAWGLYKVLKLPSNSDAED